MSIDTRHVKQNIYRRFQMDKEEFECNDEENVLLLEENRFQKDGLVEVKKVA